MTKKSLLNLLTEQATELGSERKRNEFLEEEIRRLDVFRSAAERLEKKLKAARSLLSNRLRRIEIGDHALRLLLRRHPSLDIIATMIGTGEVLFAGSDSELEKVFDRCLRESANNFAESEVERYLENDDPSDVSELEVVDAVFHVTPAVAEQIRSGKIAGVSVRYRGGIEETRHEEEEAEIGGEEVEEGGSEVDEAETG